MSGRFDAYHVWLGIPSHEQPANHYRLLGLELFESDLEAIECAADRLLKYVRENAKREQREQARAVLKDLLAARQCLVVAERKAAYDAGLRAGRRENSRATSQPPAPPIAAPTAVHIAPVAAQRRTISRKRSKPAPKRHTLTAVASSAGLIALGGLGILLFRGDSKPEKQTASAPAPQTTAAAPSPPANVVADKSAVKATDVAGDSAPVLAADASPLVTEAATTAALIPEFNGRTPLPDLNSSHEEADAESTDEQLPRSIEPEPVVEPPPESEAVPNSNATGEAAADSQLVESDGRGGLLRDVWTDVKGNQVEEFLHYVAEHPEPSETDTTDRFETPEDFGDQYGQRLRGYLHPPVTGSYEFSIRANAEAWLYVSTDALAENKRRVEPGTKIDLEAGQVYYVEAFHKESTGRDYLSIGWKLPDGAEEKPIPGERLSLRHRLVPPYESEFVVLMPVSAESSSGTKFELTDDGLILATGRSTGNETVRLELESEIETVTAIRLEAVPHDSLPASGPGHGVGGRFTLTDVSVSLLDSAAPAAVQPLSFASVVDDAGRDLRRLVDDDEKTFWRVSGRGEQAAATLIVHNPTSLAAGSTVQIELKQREGLGCIRVLATAAGNPLSALRPAAVASQSLYRLCANLGGDDFTAPDGERWRASKLFDNESFGHEGGRGVSEELITNRVQGTAVRGIHAFRAVVPEGTYEVTLYFCEYWTTSSSSRRFAIAVEGRVVESNFDLLRFAGGIAKPVVYPIRNVAVKDDRLDIELRETAEGASTILNAIRITQVR